MKFATKILSLLLLVTLSLSQNQFNGCISKYTDPFKQKVVCALCFERKFDAAGEFCGPAQPRMILVSPTGTTPSREATSA